MNFKDEIPKCVVLSLRNENSLIQNTQPNDRAHFYVLGIGVVSSNVVPDTECLCFSSNKAAHEFVKIAEVLGYEKARSIFTSEFTDINGAPAEHEETK